LFFENLSKQNAFTEKERALLILKQYINRSILADDYYTADTLRKVWDEINASI
jgi:hypothetical protein